ncbi:hypothetical protein BBP40_007536 [Aspergillus hancockii]|nr:hypothetical protein BBP40_007536 [Aspergillus hancockii]
MHFTPAVSFAIASLAALVAAMPASFAKRPEPGVYGLDANEVNIAKRPEPGPPGSRNPRLNVEIGPAQLYTPGPGDVLVKIESIGFNAVEAKIQKYAALPISYPGILGVAFAGIVEEVGPTVTSIKKGDRVVVSKWHNGGSSYSAFQKYALARESCLAKLGPSTTFDDASIAITNLATIVAALSIKLGLEPPPISAGPQGKRVLVYGGSSSCGSSSCGRFAFKDIVTKHNPSHIIDHTLPHEQLVGELKRYGPYDAVFDAIGTPPVTSVLVTMFGEVGGVIPHYSTSYGC